MLDLHPDVMSDAIKQYGKNIIEDFHSSIRVFGEPSFPLPRYGEGKVAIIGGGVGGLYAAMLLRDQKIPFEILEASNHTGGRLFTYPFSEDQHDYFDVGAMRFPETPLMKPVFHLFDTLGIRQGGKLIPYIFESPNNTLYYNSILKKRSSVTGDASEFEVPGIPSDYEKFKWSDLVNNVVEPFAKALANDVTTRGKSGWELMMEYDKYSTKAYMAGKRSDTRPELDELGKMPYPLSVVNWCETFDTSTASYDRALSETVMESLAFAWPETEAAKRIQWFCVDGGSGVIANEMIKHLKLRDGELKYNSRVTGIALDKHSNCIEVTLANGQKPKYDHVINTATLPCLRTMNLTSAELDYKQKGCLRQLRYGPATKIGIKFKSAWWEDGTIMKKFGPIVGGQSSTDNMVRTVVYPSYGVHGGRKSTVLIASYAWTEDATRLSALMSADTDSEAVLKRRILQDLVAVHGLDPEKGYKFLEEQYVESFPFSWNNNLYTMGAYGFFGPGEFVELYKHLTRPAALGRLHFAGETVSDRHGWVVGALGASMRVVLQILRSSYNRSQDELVEFEKKWGWFDDKGLEWSNATVLKQVAISVEGLFLQEETGGDEH